MSHKRLWSAIAVGVMALLLAACGGQTATPAECPEATACPTCPACPAPEEGAAAEGPAIPFLDQWLGSGHNDTEAEAFNHWNEDDPQEVPATCAKCHSTPGYQDFLGADGSEAGVVDVAASIGTTIQCVACHNDVTLTKTTVVFPSGVEVSNIGDSSRCMECHQGRSSKQTVDEAIAGGDDDTVNEELGFINIHYFAAAASLYGSEVHGGYEYDGQSYQIRFDHAGGLNECVDCHNQHTLEVRLEVCAECHEQEDPKDFRMNGSLADYDGDANMTEGMYYELETLRELLMTAIQAYAEEVAGTAIVYDELAYPYFFADANGNGAVDEGEERFASWTPRLLKAAYNYQVSTKDPGAFAHNAKYHVALLYDSIADLNTQIASPVDLAAAHRNDPGHFDGTAEAFRHWDEEGAVPAGCSKCHSSTGLPQLLAEGANISNPLGNGFACTTCHDVEAGFPARYAINEVTFPSGAKVTFGEGADGNLCLMCHQGRESTASVNKALGDLPADTPDETIRFRNVHYFAAGATLFGTEVKGAYEYEGKEYAGRFEHVNGFQTCGDCHDVHELEVKTEACAACHGSDDVTTFRIDSPDYDGDAAEEGVIGELETFSEVLYAAIQAYATDKGFPIAYEPHSYPYYFNDTNGNGEADPDEAVSSNGYNHWTPKLLKAAYNYQYSQKDPGAFAHNLPYILQVMFDSIQDLGGDTAGLTRP